MQVSKKKVNPVLEKQLHTTLFTLITDLKNPQDAQQVLASLLTNSELTSVAKRLAVAYWLSKGRSYENIKENLKVSSATIAEVQQHVKNPGWKLALQKVTAEEWASLWEQKIRHVFKR
jgi:uncharacterized protein YerC